MPITRTYPDCTPCCGSPVVVACCPGIEIPFSLTCTFDEIVGGVIPGPWGNGTGVRDCSCFGSSFSVALDWDSSQGAWFGYYNDCSWNPSWNWDETSMFAGYPIGIPPFIEVALGCNSPGGLGGVGWWINMIEVVYFSEPGDPTPTTREAFDYFTETPAGITCSPFVGHPVYHPRVLGFAGSLPSGSDIGQATGGVVISA